MKRIILIIVTAMALGVLKAQQFKVEYTDSHNSLPAELRQFFQMQGIDHRSLTLKGTFNGKRAIMKKAICQQGVFAEKKLINDPIHLVFVDSLETLDFLAIPYGRDSMRIACFYHPEETNYMLFEDTVKANKLKTLLETMTMGAGPDIPILAYSTGIPFSGGTWFCGLRDSGVEPQRWYEKYGIDDYVYYTITLEDDTPKRENDPVYVKIARKGTYATHIQQ